MTQRTLPEHIYAWCDFETTGVHVENDYPIEVGIIFTDHLLVPLHSFESLIKIPHGASLRESWSEAFDLTGIRYVQVNVASDAPPACDVRAELARQIESWFIGRNRRIVMISDNAQFEYRLMRRLWEAPRENSEQPVPPFPFHYCAWDTSLLFCAAGLADPKMVHRALPDAGRVLDVARVALQRLGLQVGYQVQDLPGWRAWSSVGHNDCGLAPRSALGNAKHSGVTETLETVGFDEVLRESLQDGSCDELLLQVLQRNADKLRRICGA